MRATLPLLLLILSSASWSRGALAVDITVSAAASLRDALTEVAKGYESSSKDRIVLNFGASGALSQQILSGAPVDILIAAAAKPMDELEKAGKVEGGTRCDLLKNSLVLIAPLASKELSGFSDLAKASVKKIAIGDPGTVPAGQYADEVFHALKLADALKPKLVLGQNVRQVLTYVETGNVEAGLVYATDAKDSAKTRIVESADPSWHAPIVYPVGVIKGSKHVEAAKAFATYLSGKAAQAVFTRFGFMPGLNPS